MIGDNQPPAYEAMSMHVEDLFALVSATTAGAEVTTDEQDAALDSLLDDLRKAKKEADGKRAEEKRPHDDAAKAVQAKWMPLLKRCDMGADEIKRLLTPYREAKQRQRDEEAREAREEAEARQRAAQEALRQPDDLEARFAAEEELKAAKKLAAVANKIDRSATGLRTLYVPEISDTTAFARWAWANRRAEYDQFLNELAEREVRATGVATAIPGLLVRTERKAA